MEGPEREIWSADLVVDVRDGAFAARTYIEHRDVRSILAMLGDKRQGAACEIGAGYGRMTVLLAESFDQVTGFEREAHLVAEAARLLPDIRFVQVASLTRLPAEDQQFDFILTFTVLQHLTDPVLALAAREIVRILRPGGTLLCCEMTDATYADGAIHDPNGKCTIGRSVAQFQTLFDGLQLQLTRPRRVEPTYPRADVGTYMLFTK